MPITVAIVEDNQEVRQGLCILIATSPGLSCIAACGTAEDAIKILPELAPDVVLMDIQLPGMSGIEAIARLKVLLPSTQMVVLTVVEDHDRIFESLRAGATGYLLKKTPPPKLLEAIKDVYNGGSPISAEVARRVVETFHNTRVAGTPLHDLSARESEILKLLSQGLLYKEIADRLEVSINTVRTHVRRIYEKLHVRSRSEAMLKTFGR